MITLPNGKICMNEQEAIAWLLDNYPIPFQCSANYAPLTEIGLGTIVNPTPAKVKIGSIIFFADSKVSTVIGVTETGFICSDKYNNLVDDVAYVVSVSINASGHLITTFSDGQTQDAGLIKQVSGFSINASQHLIVTFNDGTSTDLGAIFNGNITVSGNLTVTGGISGNAITGNSIIENMSGYSFEKIQATNWTPTYVGACKNGNKITFVVFGEYTYAQSDSELQFGIFYMPSSVGAKLYPYTRGVISNMLSQQTLEMFVNDTYNAESKAVLGEITKASDTAVFFNVRRIAQAGMEDGKTYLFRLEATFLLNDNLAA